MKIILMLGVLAMLLLVACDEVEFDSKKAVQRRLLSELDDCNYKFGQDSYEMKYNIDYCNKMLIIVEKKIDEGFFDDSERAQKIITETKEYIETEVDEDKIEIKSTDDIYQDIVGDI